MLIFRKQLFFNRACQVRRDRDFEFPTARIGGAGEGVDYRLWVAMERLAIVVKDVDFECSRALPTKLDHETIGQVRNPPLHKPRLCSVRSNRGLRQRLPFISRSRKLFAVRFHSFKTFPEMIADFARERRCHRSRLVLCCRCKT